MSRLMIVGSLITTIGIATAAYADGTPRGGAQSPGYFTETGAPLVAPSAPGEPFGTTAQKQRDSGYYPDAGAPLVAPDVGNAGAESTVRKQVESGYFPYAGAPLVPLTTTGAR
jgi:hypothetical protein